MQPTLQEKKLVLKATPVYEKNYDAMKLWRIIVNEGGSRSSKTISLCQLFITLAFSEERCDLDILRKTFPALKATVMKDFLELLKEYEIYNENDHNKTDHTYTLRNCTINFYSVDDAQKIRGRKRRYAWLNEANEFTLEDFRQIALRTTGCIFLDYNPSDEYHWIYDHVLTRKDVFVIRSTYRDNPFLDASTIKEIEQYKDQDENYWKIYGLGERGKNVATVYPKWELCDEIPESAERFYGLDFGYNNQTALVDIGELDKDHYVDELLYETHMTNSMLIDWMNNNGIDKERPIYADAAEKQRIEEIKAAGYNIISADKSVKDGIDTVKSSKIYWTKRSVNGQKEIKSYMFKTKDGKVLEEVVKVNDHLMDAKRYGIHTHLKTVKEFIGFV